MGEFRVAQHIAHYVIDLIILFHFFWIGQCSEIVKAQYLIFEREIPVLRTSQIQKMT